MYTNNCNGNRFFFSHAPPTAEVYTKLNTLSLHDALPICEKGDISLYNPEPSEIVEKVAPEKSKESVKDKAKA